MNLLLSYEGFYFHPDTHFPLRVIQFFIVEKVSLASSPKALKKPFSISIISFSSARLCFLPFLFFSTGSSSYSARFCFLPWRFLFSIISSSSTRLYFLTFLFFSTGSSSYSARLCFLPCLFFSTSSSSCSARLIVPLPLLRAAYSIISSSSARVSTSSSEVGS